MNAALSLHLTSADWLSLLLNFMGLSLLSVGGAITLAPDMHRVLVDDRGWLTDEQFTSSIALAQASPGPNVLFVALMGWHVGVNAAADLHSLGWSLLLGSLGLILTMVGIMLPSSVLAYLSFRWAARHREHRGVRAFKAGMAPMVIAFLLATAWVLTANQGQGLAHWPLWLLTLSAMVLVLKTRIHLLWLIAAGAFVGGMGWL